MSTIFVSSTFQDMQQERDILQYKVLPRLKDLAKQYGKNIELCDLRWGVNSLAMNETESAKKVLQVCFDEIDSARPFFIAFLGNRYGWIPDADIVNASMISRGVRASDFCDKSVTEMEILYRTMQNTDARNIVFYFRDISNKKRFWRDNSDIPGYIIGNTYDDKRRMKRLKEKLKDQFPKQIRTYTVSWNKDTSRLDGMESLEELLYQDIKRMIIEHWGDIPNLSKYEYQFQQYQYVFDCDSYFARGGESLIVAQTHPNFKKLNKPSMINQNYVLISTDEHGLDLLVSALCDKFRSSQAEIIPYDCSQSILSSTVENMILYFIDILENKFGKKKQHETNENEYIAHFHTLLSHLDCVLDHDIIFAIRRLQYLDKDDIWEWLPLAGYKNIHFILSCNQTLAGTSSYKKYTEEFYFQDKTMIRRDQLIHAYMARFHKEIDKQVVFTLLDKARNQDNLYLKLLMQRLLLLTQEDFEAINKSGDGMENISQYLQSIIVAAPDSTADIICSQISLLKKETSKDFVNSVLSVLLILPYGISLTELQRVLKKGGVKFSTLNMTLLCRRLTSIVNETLEGYYRMVNTSASAFLSDMLVNERSKWTIILEKYMSDLYNEGSQLAKSRDVREFYRNQYMAVALAARRTNALHLFLQNIGYDVTYTAMILRQFVLKGQFIHGLRENFSNLDADDIKWMANTLYPYMSDKKLFLHTSFAAGIIEFWKIMLLTRDRSKNPTWEENYIYFNLLYEIGELSYMNKQDDAESYLKRAKKISKENFKQYPNRIWKKLHGIALTDEEKRKEQEYLEDTKLISPGSDIMFGYDGEIQDMEFEQSWSNQVRVINNYLAQIYREKGDVATAEKLENESKTLAHISDSDPQRKGMNELVHGITMIWPDEMDTSIEQTAKKRPYRPDMRRNSAIQMSKEAQELCSQGKTQEALQKYLESNEILNELYEDGRTGEYYDLKNVVGDPNNIRTMIQNECARDLGLNYRNMIACVPMEAGSSACVEYIDKMLLWAHIYDDYCNNKQSKSDLEEHYLCSATIYNAFDNPSIHQDRILHDIDWYYTCRTEAHQKGEEMDQIILKQRQQADSILYHIVTSNPELGPRITDILLKQSNASVKANDFNGFVHITYLVEELLKQMRENAYSWSGSYCSLECIFFSNIENQTMMYEKYHITDRLKKDADRIIALLPQTVDVHNVFKGVQGVLRYLMEVFSTGEYGEIIPYAEVIFETIQRTGSGLPDTEMISVYEKLVAMYSEAEILERASEIAQIQEKLLDRVEKLESEQYIRSLHVTPSQFHKHIIIKRLIAYLNHAIVLSRLERDDEANQYLQKAEMLAEKYPDIAEKETGIIERISLFRRTGLPKSKKTGDPDKIYRAYQKQIQTSLSRYMHENRYTESDLEQVEALIRNMCAMPEHRIYKNVYILAKYYYVLYQLYASIGRTDLAIPKLEEACWIADSARNTENLYGEIYSDMCAYAEKTADKLRYAQKALKIFEQLQKECKEYSYNSYAMTLFNTGVIFMQQENYKSALEYAQKANGVWEEQYSLSPDEQVEAYISEAQRLISFLKKKVV